MTRQDTASNTNTWGAVLNSQVFDLADFAIAGVTTVALSNVDVTLSSMNGATDEARAAILKLAGVLAANVNVIIPNSEKSYIVHNGTTGAFTASIKTAAGVAVTIAQGATVVLWCDAANTVRVTSAQAASDTVAGVVELATDAEVKTATDTARAVTPAGIVSVYQRMIENVNVASAATIDLTALKQAAFHVTGTTGITAVTLRDGLTAFVTFDGALLLTNSANLILPDAANITTAAGDTAILVGEAAGVVRCYLYARKVRDAGAIASAATTVLDTAPGDCGTISGTATITAFTLAAGRRFHARATGLFSITTGASLVIEGYGSAYTYALQVGDVFDVWGEAAGVVRITGLPKPGTVVGYAHTEGTTTASTASTIPDDDTIPQIGEGAEYTQVATTYIPKYANSKLKITLSMPVIAANGADAIFAVFRDAGANAIFACRYDSPDDNIVGNISQTFQVDATSIASTAFTLRYGGAAAGTVYIGTDGTTPRFSTVRLASLTVEEIKQ